MEKEIVAYVLRVEFSSFKGGERSSISVYSEASPFVRDGNHNFQKIKIITAEEDLQSLFRERLSEIREF